MSERKGLPLNYNELTLSLKGGLHTKVLAIDNQEGKIIFFPEDNYKLAMAEGTDITVAKLKKLSKE